MARKTVSATITTGFAPGEARRSAPFANSPPEIEAQVGPGADELSDDQMEAFGAAAGGTAFRSALISGVKAAYLEDGQLKFALPANRQAMASEET
jgi:hypothetical protein